MFYCKKSFAFIKNLSQEKQLSKTDFLQNHNLLQPKTFK